MVAQESHGHAAPTGFIRKYVFSLDHKVIGLQYYFLALTAVFVGMFLSLLMRIHLVWPGAAIPLIGEIKPETYLSLLTMHGTIMVFFVLTTAPQGGFGNYFLPIQIGAPDMAFPVLNMLSFWTTFIAYLVMLSAFFVVGGAPLHGWTGYAPLTQASEVRCSILNRDRDDPAIVSDPLPQCCMYVRQQQVAHAECGRTPRCPPPFVVHVHRDELLVDRSESIPRMEARHPLERGDLEARLHRIHQ